MAHTHDAPDWPNMMRIETACAYLDNMDPRTFRKICGVRPVALAANVLRYRRADLDAWSAALPVEGGPSPVADDSHRPANQATVPEPPKSAAQGLENVRRRAAKDTAK
jgi:hypothetical protein